MKLRDVLVLGTVGASLGVAAFLARLEVTRPIGLVDRYEIGAEVQPRMAVSLVHVLGAAEPEDGDPAARPPRRPKDKPVDAADTVVPEGAVRGEGGMVFDPRAGTVTIPGHFCLAGGIIELFACAPGGKEHESVIMLACRPDEVHLSLVLLGAQEATVRPTSLGDAVKPDGDRMIVEVSWEDEGGRKTVWAEDLIVYLPTGRPMPRVGWSFLGSKMAQEIDPDTGNPTGRSVYLANRYRSLITTFHDPTAILDTPLLAGCDDTLFMVNDDLAPEPGTPATVTLRRATPEEKETLQAAEAAAEKEYGEAVERARKAMEKRRQAAEGSGDDD